MLHCNRQRTTNTLLAGTMIIASAFYMVSCKKNSNQTSSEKSLNNFANGSNKVAANDCHGIEQPVLGIKQEWDHTDFIDVDESKKGELKASLQRALSAVPSNLQTIYFSLGHTIAFKSNLHLPPKSSSDLSCSSKDLDSKFANEGSGDIDGCWTIDPKTEKMVILLNPTTDSVKHATVRMFGFVLSQVMSSLDLNQKGELTTYDNKSFQTHLDLVAKAIVNDVKNSKGKYEFAENQTIVSSPDFKYYGFAEAFDSYYCETNLRLSMNKPGEFPETYALLDEMNTELRLVTSDLSNDQSSTQTVEDGFGLESLSTQQSLGLGRFGGLFGGVGRVAGGVARFGAGTVRNGARFIGGTTRFAAGATIGAGRFVGRSVVGAKRGVFGRHMFRRG